jgi:HK97 family phage portal protein
MAGLGRLVSRALTPAPFSAPANIAQGPLPLIPAGALPVGYTGASAWGVAAPDLTAAMFAGAGEAAVTGLSASWRCLNILTNGIGGLELFAFDDSKDDARITTPRVLADPWPMVSPVEWRAMVVGSLVMHGNAYLLPYDMDPRTGYPRQLPIVHPDRMHVELVNGKLRYWLDESHIDALDVLHIRGYAPPGSPIGFGVVEAQRRGIAMANAVDAYQVGNLNQAAVPPVVIRVNRPEISEEQALDIQGKWIAKHGYGSRAPAVIPTSMEVTPIAWSPEDTQFLESKAFTAVEQCWWFGIDPRLLTLAASAQSLTYSNIESTYVDLQRMSYMPWTSRIESTLSRVLPRSVNARFDFTPILRTTLQDRYSAYKTAIEGGWLTIDEVRVMENMGPMGTSAHEAVGIGMPGRVETLTGVNDSLPAATSEVLA